ncbi:hypothetical protein SPRG_22177 [Saprolegnia parasitica CBS 223.65]|uniref:Uncharacterized protein n=1 Tax=Saprolegnia parasitica (strain CBS 223.65) TaxID=695850 RepID=A0A067CQP3_SAPPC|nr:hypothetical protein SPRG_22177 [Saprolegnia parasitica CBS 223.65]KDO28846.1 hypothetical protein SPRG_22177 [Saprolegnia parasitica CBS 223.65]|eukprot:XP_012200580.1 hypothetical protein SPRG_22177 [Saprolegnia parasitica CBS 223.65]
MDDAEDLEAELQRQLLAMIIDDDDDDEDDDDANRPAYERKSIDELLASVQDETHRASTTTVSWTAFAEATRAADVALLSAVETDLADLDLYDVHTAMQVDQRQVATTPLLPPTPRSDVRALAPDAIALTSTTDADVVSYCHAHCEPSCAAVCTTHCAPVTCPYYSSSVAAAEARHAASAAEDEVFLALSQQSVQAIAIAARVPTDARLPTTTVDTDSVVGSPTMALNYEARCDAIERKHRERVAAMEAERAAADAAYEAQQRELQREISFSSIFQRHAVARHRRGEPTPRQAASPRARQRAEDALRAEQAAHDRRLADEARRLDEEHRAFREDCRSRAVEIALARDERLARENARACDERSAMRAEDAASLAVAQALAALAAWTRNVDRTRIEERAMAAAEASERAREAAIAEADRIERERERREALRRERIEDEARREAVIKAVLAQEAAMRDALKKQALAKEEADRRLLEQREEDRRRKRLADEQRQRATLERIEAAQRDAEARDAADKERHRLAQMREKELQRQQEEARMQREAAAVAQRRETREQACMERVDREAQAREAADRDYAARLARYRRETHASVLRDLVVWVQAREHEVRQRHLSGYLMGLEDRRSFLLRKRSRVDAYAGAILGVAHASRARWWRGWVHMHIERRAARCLQRCWRQLQERRRHAYAAARVQSAFRGFHLRRKLASALELAKFVDNDDFEYDQVDVDAFLGPVDALDLDDEPPPMPRVGWEATPETETEPIEETSDVVLADASNAVINNTHRAENEEEDEAPPMQAPPESTASKLYQRMQKAVKMHRPKPARKPPPKKDRVDDASTSVTWSTSGKKAKKVNVPSLVERLRRTTAASR